MLLARRLNDAVERSIRKLWAFQSDRMAQRRSATTLLMLVFTGALLWVGCSPPLMF